MNALASIIIPRQEAFLVDASTHLHSSHRWIQVKAGYEVVGIDVSRAMLDRARTKLRPGWRGTYVQGDVRAMEFADGSFDGVGVSKLFQHVGSWQRAVAEIVRVVRPGGVVMLIDEKGAFSHTVRRRFGEECDRRGHLDRSRGNRNRDMLAEEFAEHGTRRLKFDTSDLCWTKTLSYDECLEHMRLRLHSEFWSIPDETYDEILEALRLEFDSNTVGLARTEQLRPHLRVDVFIAS